MKALLAQINPTIGAIKENTNRIIAIIEKYRESTDIIVFPELTICGYPPEDLLLHPAFIDDCEIALNKIILHTKDLLVLVGLPRKNTSRKEKPLYNSVAVIHDTKLLGFKDKTLLPTYDIFDEKRYFEAGKEEKIFDFNGKKIGIFICEDIWEHSGALEVAHYRKDPVNEMLKLKPDLAINVSASPYYYKKIDVRTKVVQKAAKTLKCPMLYCNQVGANDQLVFSGYSFSVDEKGELIAVGKGYEEDFILVDFSVKTTIVFPKDAVKDLFNALVLGVKDYFYKQNFSKALIGLSGGVDSALVACIAVEALGKENVLAVNMPSRFSSKGSVDDSITLSKSLGIKLEDISIDAIFQEYLDLLSPHFKGRSFDTTEENIQARIRGMILMAFSNKFGCIVLSTGNKSEMAMGYSTLYGDMCGGLGVLIDVSKTLVYELCRYINTNREIIPESILKKPPSAELRENQTDQDSLPDYAIVDAVLEDYVEEHRSLEEIVKKRGFDQKLVSDLIIKIHLAEYKRRQSPTGIRVTKKAFNRGRNFPIVQKWH